MTSSTVMAREQAARSVALELRVRSACLGGVDRALAPYHRDGEPTTDLAPMLELLARRIDDAVARLTAAERAVVYARADLHPPRHARDAAAADVRRRLIAVRRLAEAAYADAAPAAVPLSGRTPETPHALARAGRAVAHRLTHPLSMPTPVVPGSVDLRAHAPALEAAVARLETALDALGRGEKRLSVACAERDRRLAAVEAARRAGEGMVGTVEELCGGEMVVDVERLARMVRGEEAARDPEQIEVQTVEIAAALSVAWGRVVVGVVVVEWTMGRRGWIGARGPPARGKDEEMGREAISPPPPIPSGSAAPSSPRRTPHPPSFPPSPSLPLLSASQLHVWAASPSPSSTRA